MTSASRARGKPRFSLSRSLLVGRLGLWEHNRVLLDPQFALVMDANVRPEPVHRVVAALRRPSTICSAYVARSARILDGDSKVTTTGLKLPLKFFFQSGPAFVDTLRSDFDGILRIQRRNASRVLSVVTSDCTPSWSRSAGRDELCRRYMAQTGEDI